jgi:predicted metal-dependent phosphoesterase TrpH
MSKIKASFHNHSFHSDGLHSPWVIVMAAKFLGIKALSITDHNEISGSLKALNVAEKNGLIFFPGIECMFRVKTRMYEMIALFYDGEHARAFFNEYRYQNGFWPHFKSLVEVVEMIRRHNGAVVAPHPFGRKGVFRKLKNKGINIDAVEIVNANTADKRNFKAKVHDYDDNHYLQFGAADMHFFLDDMKKVYTELEAEGEITKEMIWENLITARSDLKATPVGKTASPFRISLQNTLAGISYILNYVRLYFVYRVGKGLYKRQTSDDETDFNNVEETA